MIASRGETSMRLGLITLAKAACGLRKNLSVIYSLVVEGLACSCGSIA